MFPVWGSAQYFTPEERKAIDSLQQAAENPSFSDSLAVSAWLELVNYYYLYDLDTAVMYTEFAKDRSEGANYLQGISDSYGWLGYLLRQQGDMEKALEYNYEALNLFITLRDTSGVILELGNLGYNYSITGDVPKAIAFYHESNKLCRKVADSTGLSYNLINLATIYSEQDQKRLAIDMFHEALDLLSRLDDKRTEGYCLINLGFTYAELEIYDSAMIYLNQSIRVREEIGDIFGLVGSYNNLGETLLEVGDYDSAGVCFKRSNELSLQMGSDEGLSTSLYMLARLDFKTGNLQSAIANGEESMRLSKELGYPGQMRSTALLLSNIYEETNNFEAALKNYKFYIEMRDSLNNLQTQTATVQQQAKFEYEKQKEIDDLENEKRIELERKEKERQRVITYAISGGLLLITGFLIFVFNRLRVSRRQNQIIASQKQEVETQKEEIENQKHQVELAHAQLERKNEEVMDSITYARRIQKAILPPNSIVKKLLPAAFILYKPKDIVAGDFYWLDSSVVNTGNGDESEVLFAAADCTGHGVPGALVSVVCNNAMNRAVREYGLRDPGQILDKVRDIVIAEFSRSDEEVKDGMDIALVSLAKKSDMTTRLKFAGANNPLWLIRDQELIEIKADKQPIGKYAEHQPFTTHEMDLKAGDCLYVFSDGYADQFGGEKGKKFKARNMKDLLLGIHKDSPESQKYALDKAFEDWRGSLEQVDDVCVIGVRI